MTTETVRVALVGLGPIGIEVGRALVGRPGVTLLGAADPAPSIAGRELAEVIAGAAPSGPIAGSAVDLYSMSTARRGRADVAVICTGSRLASVTAQIGEALEAGLHVVSTCEELSFPYLRHPRVAQRLDELAKKRDRVVLGTGVNPGLVMDRLVLAAAGACVRVEHVAVTRVVDAAKRRGPLRAKVGAGIADGDFRAGAAAGRYGHVGLAESAAMIARGLRMSVDDIVETIEPVIAEKDEHGVAAGRVLGVHQTARVVSGGRARVELDLAMFVGALSPHDHIRIDGDPPVDLRVEGGFQGDRATVGTVVNAIPYVVSGPPGLRTVISLPLFGIMAPVGD